MLQMTNKHNVFIALEPIDFRKGIDGLRNLCQSVLAQAPYSGHFFVFCNRRRTSIKILAYDGQGFVLYQKRLSMGKFRHWPTSPHQVASMTPEQLQVLLRNGDPSVVITAANWKTLA